MRTTERLFSKLTEAQKQGVPFVIFRYPNSEMLQLWIQQSKALYLSSEFDREGFVFAPFNLKDGAVLFPKDSSERCKATITDLKVSSSAKAFRSQLSEKDKAIHISLVDSGIQFLNNSGCRKVVLSREEKVQVENFDLVATYTRMLKKYSNACVYLWSHPDVGIWMGASPERLLHFESNRIETTSLAGTQEYAENLSWGSKELEEQQIVTNYITDVLNNHLESVHFDGPKTSKAGNLAHLKTVITGKIKDTSSLKGIVEKLHPTPAVCGMPKEGAYDFIVANEHYNRGFYTGFFGELNFQSATNLFVNLRCMKYREDKVHIYIGGGITAASNSEKEWEETVAKAGIMKAIL